MNREILFRGKRADNGKWIEGYFVSLKGDKHNYILTGMFHLVPFPIFEHFTVILSTVGQYTGLTDKNGRKIFEGDILKRHNHKYVVEWCDDCAMFVLPCITDEKLENDFTIFYGYEFEIIGNVHDNPEMIKVEY